MDKLTKASAAISLLVALLGLAAFFLFIGDAKGAPQEASLAAMILCAVIPPYIVTRCLALIAGGPGAAD